MKKIRIYSRFLLAIICLGVLIPAQGCSYLKPHYFSESPVKIATLAFNPKNDKITGIIVNKTNLPIRSTNITVDLHSGVMGQLIEVYDLKPNESRHFSDKAATHYEGSGKIKAVRITTADGKGNIVEYTPDTN